MALGRNARRAWPVWCGSLQPSSAKMTRGENPVGPSVPPNQGTLQDQNLPSKLRRLTGLFVTTMFANRCVNTAAFDVPASSRTQLQSLQGQIEMKFPARCCSLGNFWWRRPASTGVWGQSFMQHHSVLIELWTEVSWKSMQYERHLTACENEVSIDDTVAFTPKGNSRDARNVDRVPSLGSNDYTQPSSGIECNCFYPARAGLFGGRHNINFLNGRHLLLLLLHWRVEVNL